MRFLPVLAALMLAACTQAVSEARAQQAQDGGGAFLLEAASQKWKGQTSSSASASEGPALPAAATIRGLIRERQARAYRACRQHGCRDVALFR